MQGRTNVAENRTFESDESRMSETLGALQRFVAVRRESWQADTLEQQIDFSGIRYAL